MCIVDVFTKENIALIANIGTLIALWFTYSSIQTSNNQNKKISSKNLLDTVFKNLEDSLHGLTFYRVDQGGAETHFGKDAIYRFVANANINGITNNKMNYKLIPRFVQYLVTAQELIKEPLENLGDINLKKFYKDKFDLELLFAKEYLKKAVDGVLKTDSEKDHHEALQRVIEQITSLPDNLK